MLMFSKFQLSDKPQQNTNIMAMAFIFVPFIPSCLRSMFCSASFIHCKIFIADVICVWNVATSFINKNNHQHFLYPPLVGNEHKRIGCRLFGGHFFHSIVYIYIYWKFRRIWNGLVEIVFHQSMLDISWFDTKANALPCYSI